MSKEIDESGTSEAVAFRLYRYTRDAAGVKTIDDELNHFARCLVTVQSPSLFYQKK